MNSFERARSALDHEMAAMRDADELRKRIRDAFPAEQYFGPVTNGCTCEECTAPANALLHQRWDALSDETLEEQFGSLPLLSPEALAAFLPAWMIRSLDNLDLSEQKIREWTLYELALYYDEKTDEPDELPSRIDRLRRRAAALMPQQIGVVARFLRFVQDHAAIAEWDRESIRRGLEVAWQR